MCRSVDGKYVFSIGKREDTEEINHLLQSVYDALPDKDIFVLEGPGYVEHYMEEDGFVVVARTLQGEIAGCFVITYPGDGEDNLGRDIHLPKEELFRVVHMDTAVVDGKHRGSGLQYQMLKYAETHLKQEEHRYLMCTISPNNPASYRSLEKDGYVLQKTKEKYGGKLRRIYLKEIGKSNGSNDLKN